MSTTLELVDRAVETPIPKARRRRFWLVWWLWGIFGTAFSMHGVSDGTWMAVALLLTSPFWVLFCLWPCLWLRDRLRAKRLWADSVGVVLAEAPRAGASSSTDDTADIAIPIVIGRSGVLVPMVGWLAAFPSLDEAYLRTKGIRLTPADALPGVHIDGVMRDELLRGIAHIALTADAASLHHSSKGIVNDDLEAADHWCAALRQTSSGSC